MLVLKEGGSTLKKYEIRSSSFQECLMHHPAENIHSLQKVNGILANTPLSLMNTLPAKEAYM